MGAAQVVTPHGATLSLIIFCQPRTAVMEYAGGLENKTSGNGLYTKFAAAFELPYWTIWSGGAERSPRASTSAVHARRAFGPPRSKPAALCARVLPQVE